MTEQKEIRIEDLNDDNCLARITSAALQNKLTCNIAAGLPGAGYLSKELINKMIVAVNRAGKTLTSLYLSSEDTADVVDWKHTVDSETAREIFERTNTSDIATYTRYCLKEGKVYGFSFVDGIADVDSVCVGIIDRS